MNRLRLGSALVGFLLALLSVVTNDARLGWAAIVALAVSIITRIILRRRAGRHTDDKG